MLLSLVLTVNIIIIIIIIIIEYGGWKRTVAPVFETRRLPREDHGPAALTRVAVLVVSV